MGMRKGEVGYKPRKTTIMVAHSGTIDNFVQRFASNIHRTESPESPDLARLTRSCSKHQRGAYTVWHYVVSRHACNCRFNSMVQILSEARRRGLDASKSFG